MGYSPGPAWFYGNAGNNQIRLCPADSGSGQGRELCDYLAIQGAGIEYAYNIEIRVPDRQKHPTAGRRRT